MAEATHSGELQALAKKVDSLNRLVAVLLVNGKSQRDQVRLLSVSGLGPKEIADLIGTTQNTVNVALSEMRKKGKLNLKFEGGKENGDRA
jgi:DNA-directed RNA polymerase specialized sigma24 family protein